ncbi:glycyl-radical enzyme activating protein [Breznakiella homolactica]|uniref:Glycyl-radical enzyme activating protein n=1 Tax=Breznakiella homolactica TaxID=2798577 RepID=A0A7T7XNX6_9SPIR|nr:glycyl-radical enzyme activating protein [Breznakiella homolactica]QQO09806.1 glycyl-radical enzyme activating protein [Breznakiella homolactica]
MSILITNIQRSSFHDGPGVRTTVFFKGCSLRCPWCANPENISFNIEFFYNESICIKENNKCLLDINCPILKKSSGFKKACSANAIMPVGTVFTSEELFEELMSDELYYHNGGGVTFSGGEPFYQLYLITDVLRNLRKQNIHLCAETSLFVPMELIIPVYEEIDLYFVDLKILNPEICFKILGGEIEQFLQNLDLLFSHKKDIIFRIALVEGITATEENINLIEKILQKYKPIKVEYFELHRMAEKKYLMLEKKMPTFPSVSKERMKQFKRMLIRNNVQYSYLEN